MSTDEHGQEQHGLTRTTSTNSSTRQLWLPFVSVVSVRVRPCSRYTSRGERTHSPRSQALDQAGSRLLCQAAENSSSPPLVHSTPLRGEVWSEARDRPRQG